MTADHTAQSDAQLMAAVARGDMQSLGLLIERHQLLARRLAYRWLRSWPDADDIAQEAFLRVLKAASSYQPSAGFTTWLYRIVVNLCLDNKRRHARRDILPLPDETGIAKFAASPSASLISEELAAQVRHAVQSLPPRQRMAVILLRYEGLTYRQIADAMQISESAVDSLLSRAWATLRLKLARLSRESAD